MTQPPEPETQAGPVIPEIPPRPRPSWIRRNAPLAMIAAGILGVGAGIGIGSTALTTTVTKVQTNTVYETITPADTSAPTPAPAQTTPDTLSAGQAAQLQDNSGAAIGAITVESADVTTQSADGSGTAPANGEYVVVHVKATADSSYTSGWTVSESQFYDLAGSQHYSNGNSNAFDALTSAQANSLNAKTRMPGEVY
jgi:hypothetical protein